MKNTISIKIPEGYLLELKKGDKVTSGQVIAIFNKAVKQTEIPASTILKIKAEKIMDYLVGSQSEIYYKNTVIFSKKTFLSRVKILSPFDGKISKIDKDKGVVFFTPKEMEKTDIRAPFSGTVIKTDKEELTLEYSAECFEAIETSGSESKGGLLVWEKRDSLFDISDELAGRIILTGEFPTDNLVKAQVIGLSGIISSVKLYPGLTSAVVSKKVFDKLKNFEGRECIIRVKEKEIAVI